MRTRCYVVIAIALVLINGLSAVVGASALLHPPAAQNPIVTLTPMPDLVVLSITTYPSPLVKDRPATVRVEVRNQGSAGTMTTCWVGLYIDRPPVGDPNHQMFGPDLGVDQSAIISYTVTLADVGYHAVTAWADWLEIIPEEDEANNRYSVPILVVEPTPIPTSTPTAARFPTPTPQPGEPINLVYNGDFEGPFAFLQGLGAVAEGWTPFVETDGVPQFLKGVEHAKGQNSQRIWSDYVPFRAGIYQRVVGASPRATYIARAEVLSIFGEGDAPVQGMNIGKQIGLDPQGGDDPSSPNVIWSDVNWEDRAWQEGEQALWVSATVEAGVITLFIRVDNVYGGHNDLFYVDEVTLYAFEPTPTVTQTPVPTTTGTPTFTPLPSPTVTSPRLPTLSPSVTPLPLETATSTPTPILSPTPVGEGRPSPAPIPTSTPIVLPASSALGRLIPGFFALALLVILILTMAILWLQRTGE